MVIKTRALLKEEVLRHGLHDVLCVIYVWLHNEQGQTATNVSPSMVLTEEFGTNYLEVSCSVLRRNLLKPFFLSSERFVFQLFLRPSSEHQTAVPRLSLAVCLFFFCQLGDAGPFVSPLFPRMA